MSRPEGWNGRRFEEAPPFLSRIFWAIILGGLLLGAVSMAAHGETLNELRAAHGLAALRTDGVLTVVANQQAERLARQSRGRCSMANLNHDGFGPPSIAENVSCGTTNATAAIQQWMKSPGHRANILLRSARTYGLGHARSSDGSMYWAMELGP
jgi:uncharacterized protein YkwD